jgi:hypothetical protein
VIEKCDKSNFCNVVDYQRSVITKQEKNMRNLMDAIRACSDKNYSVIKVHNDFIPKNAKLVECYETDKEIIVCGDPKEDDENHNCDFMRCSSVSHVLYRFKKEGEV